jgi:hypothetical protein
MESIKQLGTNGGGYFNANGASPFENPTGLTNFLSIALILCIPVALTYTFGKMVGSVRQGAVILGVIALTSLTSSRDSTQNRQTGEFDRRRGDYAGPCPALSGPVRTLQSDRVTRSRRPIVADNAWAGSDGSQG